MQLAEGRALMAWGRIEDNLWDNEKLAGVSDAAYRLYVQALSWANAKLTDGFVPSSRPARLAELRKPKDTIKELLDARLWHYSGRPCASCLDWRKQKSVTDEIPHGGYLIHDFHEYNRAAWAIRADREKMRELGRRGGVRSGEVRGGGEAPRLSAPLHHGERADDQERSATLERHAEAEGPITGSATLKPVPPRSRTPVPPSSNEGASAAEGDPPIPDAPEARRPAAPGGTDRLRDRDARTPGLRPLRGAIKRVAYAAGARTRS